MRLTVDIVYDLEDEVNEEDSAHSDSKVKQPPPKKARKIRQLMLMYMITVPDQLQSTSASLLEQSKEWQEASAGSTNILTLIWDCRCEEP